MSRTLIRESAIYGGGVLLGRMLGFLLIPVYTRYLTTADYGVLALLTLILQGVTYLCLLGVSSATNRYYFSNGADEEYRQRLFGHSTLLLLVVPGLLLVAVIPLSALLVGKYLDIPFVPYVLPILLTGLTSPIIQLMNGLLTIRRQALQFAAFHLAFFITQTTAIIVAVAVLGYGLRGQVLAQLATSALFAVVAYVILSRYSQPRFVPGLTRPLLMFGIPMLPSFASLWIDMGAGRFALTTYAGLHDVGIYLLASQFAGIVALAGSSLEQALSPHFLRRAGQGNANHELGILMTRFIGLIVLLGISLMLFAPTAIVVMSSEAYYAAIPYVAPLTVAAVLSVARLPINWSLSHSHRPALLSLINTTSTICLVLLLVLFLGRWELGIRGVAYATIAVNLLALVAGTIAAQARFRLHLSPVHFGALAALLVGCWALVPGSVETALDPAVLVAKTLGIMVAAAGALRMLGITNPLLLLRGIRG